MELYTYMRHYLKKGPPSLKRERIVTTFKRDYKQREKKKKQAGAKWKSKQINAITKQNKNKKTV